MRATDLLSEYFDRTKRIRTDLLALGQFDMTRSSDSTPDEVKLFWEMWRPSDHFSAEGSPPAIQDNPQALDDDIEDTVLEELALLERECRISYVPDADLSKEQLDDLIEPAIQYVHVGAASALRREKRDGLTDDVRDTLQEVWKILAGPILEITYDKHSLSVTDVAEAHGVLVSQVGIKALVLSELVRVRSLDGKYQEAFDMAFDSFISAEAVSDAVDVDREVLLDAIGENRLAIEEETRDAIRRCLPLQDPQQVVDCFEDLKRQDKTDNWRLVARQCARLAQTIDDDLCESSFLDGNRQEIDWYGYWRRAQGWAEEHLGSQELRDLQKQYEEEASEDRLKGYFFGESWGKIPQKARDRLINVDRAWLAKPRGGDIGAVLNDLQVAAEVMCHSFIWEPLGKYRGDQTLLTFLKKDKELTDKGLNPTLSDYAWVCKDPGFRKFVNDRGASEEGTFLHQILPKELYPLRKLRDAAQHNPEKRMHREEVEPLVQSFLGIGRTGVLRCLVEVGQKLVSK